MSDVVWMTAKFHEAKPSEICHPNYKIPNLTPKHAVTYTKTMTFLSIYIGCVYVVCSSHVHDLFNYFLMI